MENLIIYFVGVYWAHVYRGPCVGIIYTHPSRVGGIQKIFSPIIHSSTIQISQFNLLLWALNFPLTSQAIFFYFNRLVCADISNGQENFPIPATNLVDNPPVPPSGTLQTFKEVSYPMLYRCCIFLLLFELCNFCFFSLLIFGGCLLLLMFGIIWSFDFFQL